MDMYFEDMLQSSVGVVTVDGVDYRISLSENQAYILDAFISCHVSKDDYKTARIVQNSSLDYVQLMSAEKFGRRKGFVSITFEEFMQRVEIVKDHLNHGRLSMKPLTKPIVATFEHFGLSKPLSAHKSMPRRKLPSLHKVAKSKN
jgi:hypothetical protein